MEACDLEENPQIFRQKTAPGPSGTLSEVQPSISSGVKPPQTSDAFDFSGFLTHVFCYRKQVFTRRQIKTNSAFSYILLLSIEYQSKSSDFYNHAFLSDIGYITVLCVPRGALCALYTLAQFTYNQMTRICHIFY